MSPNSWIFKWEKRTEITYGKLIAYNVAFKIKKIEKKEEA